MERKIWSKDWFVWSESGGLFWGLPCYLYLSKMTFELHFEPSNYSSMIDDHAALEVAPLRHLLQLSFPPVFEFEYWVTVGATSLCISLLIQCYSDHVSTNVQCHVFDQDRRLELSSHNTLILPRVKLWFGFTKYIANNI